MTYEYACTACAHHWEEEQSISAPPSTTCPSCHAETARRLVSGGQGFILKGGGWYADGYGSSKAGASSSSSVTKSSTETKSDAAKTETAKPEPAAPAATKSETKGSGTGST